jgi:hypothetical protein
MFQLDEPLLLSLIYLFAGAMSGFLAGLLGVGGGLILVPVLLALLPFAAIPTEFLMHTALGSSLAAIVLTSIASLRAHHANGNVRWLLFRRLTPGLMIGALLAGSVAAQLKSMVLSALFACFALILAWRLWRAAQQPTPNQAPPDWTLSLAGLVIGLISGLVGIGGGSLTVPLLLRFRVVMAEAVATSAACGLPIAAAGTVGYIVAGWAHAATPLSSGFVYWPAVLTVAVASWFTAPVGARLAQRWPPARLKRVFALFLTSVACKLLFDLL